MADQLTLSFGRVNTPLGVFGDVLSDLIGGSNLQPRLTAVFYSAFAVSWFTSVSEGYDVKSAGGVDELGVSWEDIKPSTKAYHRPDLRREVFLPEVSRLRPTLTEAQNRVWKHIYLSQLAAYPAIEADYRNRQQRAFAFLVQIEDEDRAKSRAAAIAWREVKERYGAKTLLEIIGTKKASLLKKTDRLRESYSPGSGVPYQGPPEQIFQPVVGGLRLGSRVPYAGPVTRKRPVQPRGPSKWARKALLDGLIAVRQNMTT